MWAAPAGRVNGPKSRGGSSLHMAGVGGKGSPVKLSLSASAGFVSWRDTKSGSWYVETLDGVFEQWAPSEDLQTLLLRVSVASLWGRRGKAAGRGARRPRGQAGGSSRAPGPHQRVLVHLGLPGELVLLLL